MQFGQGRPGNGMNDKVDLSPLLLQTVKNLFQLSFRCNIAWQCQGGAQLVCKGSNEGASFVIQIGDAEFSAQTAEYFSTTIGDALVVGDAENNATLAGQIYHFSFHGGLIETQGSIISSSFSDCMVKVRKISEHA